MFILPCATIRKIEGILSSFLWKGVSLSSTGSKVSWNSVCYPLQEGGLGIKSLKTWNQAATMKHIWKLFAEKQSIWAAWVHTTHIRQRSFWNIKLPSTPSTLTSTGLPWTTRVSDIINGDQWQFPDTVPILQSTWSSATYTKKNDITHLIARLLLSTTVYFIWHERNNRVFNNAFQPPSATVDAILQRIRIHITNMNYEGTCPSIIQDIWGLNLAT
ncbi:hypothetical protein NC653_031908 [Populus alba x Populus x berolinensis]|uniref:Reverse transcriptase zinc-binding domain-containing protein n=1 Tax=Populus alba x Populus x berolinensis TaxID=444605 RepID=A0AAD6Q3A1_9ROSI|nr:hypothetical protein NC653_031908 [Populus alba x Populus x berolinensis]